MFTEIKIDSKPWESWGITEEEYRDYEEDVKTNPWGNMWAEANYYSCDKEEN